MNQRQELFCRGVIAGKSGTQAAKDAGYSAKTAGRHAVRLTQNDSVKARIAQLNEMAVSAKVMTVLQRKERLSEIAMARLTDFVECGADGSWINVGLESVSSAAIQEITSSTEYDKDGSKPTVIIKLKLHPPVQAIAELNKMEGAYAPVKAEITGKDGGPIKQEQTVFRADKVPDAELEAAVKEVERLLLQ